MSLTQAAALNDDGRLDGRLRDWSERSGKKRKTIFKAIEDLYAWRPLDFGVNYDFIYQPTLP
jgi:hypothetical protein